MNPDGKGSGPLQLGSTRHPFFPGFMTSVARWWEYQRQGAPGPGLCVEPFVPCPRAFCRTVTAVSLGNLFGY